MKILQPTLIGAIASALILGIGAAVIMIVEDTPGAFFGNSGRGFWWFALILGALFGAAIGGVEALFVSYLQIRVLWTILFGSAVGLIYLMTYVFDIRAAWDENLQRFAQLVVIWQVIYPTVISLISTSPKEFE